MRYLQSNTLIFILLFSCKLTTKDYATVKNSIVIEKHLSNIEKEIIVFTPNENAILYQNILMEVKNLKKIDFFLKYNDHKGFCIITFPEPEYQIFHMEYTLYSGVIFRQFNNSSSTYFKNDKLAILLKEVLDNKY